MTTNPNHRAMGQALRDRATSAPGLSPQQLRRAILARAAGGAALDAPYDVLVRNVVDASYRVTDAEVAAVRQATGGDKAAFEILMTAAIGAAMIRFDRAMEALEGAANAAG